MCNCHCGHLSAAEANNGSSTRSHGTPAGRYVTLREVQAMSVSVRRLFEDSCTDSRVDRMLLRTGKVSAVNISHCVVFLSVP